MATIGTAIKLNDMMTDPIHSITNAMNMMLSSWESLDSATSGGLNMGDVESIRAELNNATESLNRMGNEQDDFNQKVKNGSDALGGLTDKILGAVGAYMGMQGMGKLIDLSDTYTQTQARLGMIVDDLNTVETLTDKIYASAQRSRAGFQDTADAVAKLSLNAGDAFGSNDETILFAENLNKLFAIAGTEQASVASATLQLTQALGSGVLRGEEFNAVFEAAPNIMQTVADYMNVPIGQLRKMAQEGEITAAVVKNALLNATGEINEQFGSMPMTWGQVWTGVMNELYYASMPLLELINLLAQHWTSIQPIVIGAAVAVGLYTTALLINKGITAGVAFAQSIKAASDMMAAGATFSATVAQHGFNAALFACPITWIILAVIALIAVIYAVVAAINKAQGTTVSATGIIMGALAAAGAFIWNLFVGLVDLTFAVINEMINPWIRFVNFFANIFNDPIASILYAFGSMADGILGVLENIASAIDAVFGSNLAGAVSGWRSGLSGMIEGAVSKYGNGSYEKVVEELNLGAEDIGLKRWAYGDAWDTGYAFGEGVEDKVGNLFGMDALDQYGDFGTGIGGASDLAVPSYEELKGINNGVDDINSSLDITHEDLKYLRDLAEQEVINRFTTAEIKVDMGGVNNNVSQNTDLDGVIDYMVTGVRDAMERVAEGVYA